MTTKFKKSNIDVFGDIVIRIGNEENPIFADDRKNIQIRGLKQSKSGVYCLRNKLNGRLYIGMARNLEVRKQRHVRDLRKGEHCSKLLQSDFDSSRYNLVWDLFEFEVIIYCYPSQLTFWEGLLIDNLKPYYNVKKKKELTYQDDEENFKDLDF